MLHSLGGNDHNDLKTAESGPKAFVGVPSIVQSEGDGAGWRAGRDLLPQQSGLGIGLNDEGGTGSFWRL